MTTTRHPASELSGLIPQVGFELISTLVGETSVTLYYKGVRGRPAAETYWFGPYLKVVRVCSSRNHRAVRAPGEMSAGHAFGFYVARNEQVRGRAMSSLGHRP